MITTWARILYYLPKQPTSPSSADWSCTVAGAQEKRHIPIPPLSSNILSGQLQYIQSQDSAISYQPLHLVTPPKIRPIHYVQLGPRLLQKGTDEQLSVCAKWKKKLSPDGTWDCPDRVYKRKFTRKAK